MRHNRLFFALAFLGRAAAQDSDENNPVVDVSSCQNLTCGLGDNSVCSANSQSGEPHGVGIAAQAVNHSSTSLSFTLIDGLDSPGFTGVGSYQYEYTDKQLFVGLDPSLNDGDYPSGCVLMMQYSGQTFPLETFNSEDEEEDVRPISVEDTTSCRGVIDSFCRSSIIDMIQSFTTNSSSNSTSSDHCMLLTSYVNEQLQKNDGTCGGDGTWIANFMNVTGGALPTGSENDLNDELGSDDCYAVLPAEYRLHKVAEMRQLYLADPPASNADYYENLFGGLAGFTPVISVLYSDNDMSEIEDNGVQFSCMKTYEPEGDAMQDPFEGAATAHSGDIGVAGILTLLLCAGFMISR